LNDGFGSDPAIRLSFAAPRQKTAGLGQMTATGQELPFGEGEGWGLQTLSA